MSSLQIKAYAKINIGLRITGVKDNGYHTLRTLYQTINLHDNIQLERINNRKIIFAVEGSGVPTGEDNICHKAAMAMLDKFKPETGVKIKLQKQLPVGAGLGGGSSDAASVIRGINQLLELGLSIIEMENIAVELGADVPFFIRGGCQYAEGIGDILSEGFVSNTFTLLLIIPEIEVSTSWAYNNINLLSLTRDTTPVNLTRFPTNGEVDMAKYFRNDFEPLIFSKYPEIAEIKNQLTESGAYFASLSGSGSAVFGLFEEPEEAKKAEGMIGTKYRSWVLKLVPGEAV